MFIFTSEQQERIKQKIGLGRSREKILRDIIGPFQVIAQRLNIKSISNKQLQIIVDWVAEGKTITEDMAEEILQPLSDSTKSFRYFLKFKPVFETICHFAVTQRWKDLERELERAKEMVQEAGSNLDISEFDVSDDVAKLLLQSEQNTIEMKNQDDEQTDTDSQSEYEDELANNETELVVKYFFHAMFALLQAETAEKALLAYRDLIRKLYQTSSLLNKELVDQLEELISNFCFTQKIQNIFNHYLQDILSLPKTDLLNNIRLVLDDEFVGCWSAMNFADVNEYVSKLQLAFLKDSQNSSVSGALQRKFVKTVTLIYDLAGVDSTSAEFEKTLSDRDNILVVSALLQAWLNSDPIPNFDQISRFLFPELMMADETLFKKLTELYPLDCVNLFNKWKNLKETNFPNFVLSKWQSWAQVEEGSFGAHCHLILALYHPTSISLSESHEVQWLHKVDIKSIDFNRFTFAEPCIEFDILVANALQAFLNENSLENLADLQILMKRSAFYPALTRIDRGLLYRAAMHLNNEIILANGDSLLDALLQALIDNNQQKLGPISLRDFLTELLTAPHEIQTKIYPFLMAPKFRQYVHANESLFIAIMQASGLTRFINIFNTSSAKDTFNSNNEYADIKSCLDDTVLTEDKSIFDYKNLLRACFLSNPEHVSRLVDSQLLEEYVSHLDVASLSSETIQKLDIRVRKECLSNVNVAIGSNQFRSLALNLGRSDKKEVIINILDRDNDKNEEKSRARYAELDKVLMADTEEKEANISSSVRRKASVVSEILQTQIGESEKKQVLSAEKVSLLHYTDQVLGSWSPRNKYSLMCCAGKVAFADIFYNLACRQIGMSQSLCVEVCERDMKDFITQWLEQKKVNYSKDEVAKELKRIEGLLRDWISLQPEKALVFFMNLFNDLVLKGTRNDLWVNGTHELRKIIIELIFTTPRAVKTLFDRKTRRDDMLPLVRYIQGKNMPLDNVETIFKKLGKNTPAQKQRNEEIGEGELKAMRQISQMVANTHNISDIDPANKKLKVIQQAGEEAEEGLKRLGREKSRLWRMWYRLGDWIKGKVNFLQHQYVGKIERIKPESKKSIHDSMRNSSKEHKKDIAALKAQNVGICTPSPIAAKKPESSKRRSSQNQISADLISSVAKESRKANV